MKIIGGKYRGRNFYLPEGVRATQNIVRKALFDILGQDMEGLDFLDIFAGSGAVGLEAVSRGAKRTTFVEREPKCVQAIEENFKILQTDAYELIAADAFAAIKQLARQKRMFDIIFMDPPYHLDLAKKALKTLKGYDILHPNCIVIVQHEKTDKLPPACDPVRLFREEKYGGSVLSFYRK